jgi:hypothetical protein
VTGGIASGTIVGATGETGEPNHAGVSLPLNSVWYRFTLGTSKTVTFSTCNGTAYNSVLAAYTGTSVGALTSVVANDDACSTRSKLIFEAAAGTTYRIAVDGFGSNTGSFSLAYGVRNRPSHLSPSVRVITPAR